jgi:molybdopterin synthase catalytic subunit
VPFPTLVEGPVNVQALEENFRARGGTAVVTLQAVLRADRTEGVSLDHVIYERGTDADGAFTELKKQAAALWPGTRLCLQHRLGVVRPGETTLFVAAGAPKASEALQVCRWTLDQIRQGDALRREEVYRDGARRPSPAPHETLLVFDEEVILPDS